MVECNIMTNKLNSDIQINIKKDLKNLNIAHFIEKLNKVSEVIIFGGYIRDKYLHVKEQSRDIDIVVILKDKKVSLYDIIREETNKNIRINAFGGYKIFFEKIEVDIWELKDTWAFKHNQQPVRNPKWRELTNTVYTNMDSIAFNYSTGSLEISSVFKIDKTQKYTYVKHVSKVNPDKELIVYRKKYENYLPEFKFDKSIQQEYINLRKNNNLQILYDKQLKKYKKEYFTLSELKKIVDSFEF